MKRSLLVAAAVVCAIIFPAPKPVAAAERQETIRGTCMGTTYAVTVVDRPAEWPLESLAEQIGDELERIEQIFSLYRPTSELSRLNAAASSEWIGVSSDVLAVTKRAAKLAEATDGAFDPTVRPLVKLWRLQQLSTDWSPPSREAIAKSRHRVDFHMLETRDNPPAIRKLASSVELDLNALVEGWAIDHLIDLLRCGGLTNALVELGGEFRAVGHKPNGQPWKIGIENPQAPNSLYATAILKDAALATSGNYRQAIEYRGRRYGHILDARTGAPTEHDLLAVAVIADEATTADGWATALMTLGPAEGFELAETKGLVASFAVRSGAKLHVKLTKKASNQFTLAAE
jgi:thiamine biosynthesis lipoprotein